MNKYIVIVKRFLAVILNIIAICTSLLAYILPINKYEGQGLPYTVEINAILCTEGLLIISVLLSIIAFILGRHRKVALLIFIILIMANSYELGSVVTISNFADKGILPSHY